MFSCVCLEICSVLLVTHFTLTIGDTTTRSYPIATTEEPSLNSREGRGMDMMSADYDHDHKADHDHDHDHMPEEQKAVKTDPWAGYYDFIINEGSFKFWAVFQLVTAILLIYSAFAAVYYAKFNVITADYDYYDDFFGRSYSGTPPARSSSSTSSWLGLSSQTYQRIFDALTSKKYS